MARMAIAKGEGGAEDIPHSEAGARGMMLSIVVLRRTSPTCDGRLEQRRQDEGMPQVAEDKSTA